MIWLHLGAFKSTKTSNIKHQTFWLKLPLGLTCILLACISVSCICVASILVGCILMSVQSVLSNHHEVCGAIVYVYVSGWPLSQLNFESTSSCPGQTGVEFLLSVSLHLWHFVLNFYPLVDVMGSTAVTSTALSAGGLTPGAVGWLHCSSLTLVTQVRLRRHWTLPG